MSTQERKLHDVWMSFTIKLRKLMEENPDLPVVVYTAWLSDSDIYDCDYYCDIAYIKDEETGEILEKVIAVKSRQQDEYEIPF